MNTYKGENMDIKLTLKLDDGAIRAAKEYARARNTSLSRLVEGFFLSMAGKGNIQNEISPVVQELSGIIQLDKNFDIKKDYSRFLEDKYR